MSLCYFVRSYTGKAYRPYGTINHIVIEGKFNMASQVDASKPQVTNSYGSSKPSSTNKSKKSKITFKGHRDKTYATTPSSNGSLGSFSNSRPQSASTGLAHSHTSRKSSSSSLSTQAGDQTGVATIPKNQLRYTQIINEDIDSVTSDDICLLINCDFDFDFIVDRVGTLTPEQLNPSLGNFNPVEHALLMGKDELAQKLLNAGANLNLIRTEELLELLTQQKHFKCRQLLRGHQKPSLESVTELIKVKTPLEEVRAKLKECAPSPQVMAIKFNGKTTLEITCEAQQFELIADLLTVGANPYTPFSSGHTLFQFLCKSTQFELVTKLIKEQKLPITQTELNYLVQNCKDKSVIEAAIAAIKTTYPEFDVNKPIANQTLLEIAHEAKSETSILVLIASGADVNIPFSTGKSFKDIFKEQDKLKHLHQLLRRHAPNFVQLEKQIKEGTPISLEQIHSLVVHGFDDGDVAQAITNSSALDFNQKINGHSLFEVLAENYYINALIALLNLDHDLDDSLPSGEDLQTYATRTRQPQLLMVALQAPNKQLSASDIGDLIKSGCKYDVIIEHLEQLKQCEGSHFSSSNASDLLNLAFEAQRVNIIEYLLINDITADTAQPFVTELKKQAVKTKNGDLLTQLTSLPQFHVQCEDLHDLLVLKTSSSHILFLIQNMLDRSEADIIHRPINEKSLFLLACELGRDSIITKLIELGADIDVTFPEQKSLAHVLVENGCPVALKQVISKKGKQCLSETKSPTRDTPMHVACQQGNEFIVEVILTQGGKEIFKLENHLKQTPLDIIANRAKSDPFIRILLTTLLETPHTDEVYELERRISQRVHQAKTKLQHQGVKPKSTLDAWVKSQEGFKNWQQTEVSLTKSFDDYFETTEVRSPAQVAQTLQTQALKSQNEELKQENQALRDQLRILRATTS